MSVNDANSTAEAILNLSSFRAISKPFFVFGLSYDLILVGVLRTMPSPGSAAVLRLVLNDEDSLSQCQICCGTEFFFSD